MLLDLTMLAGLCIMEATKRKASGDVIVTGVHVGQAVRRFNIFGL